MKKLKLVICSIVFSLFLISFASAHDWMAPASSKDITPPINSSDQAIAMGKELYETFCMSCHGSDLRGLTAKQTGLQHNTPDLITRLRTQSSNDFAWKIVNGRGDMPAFGEDLDDEEIWSIIYYIQNSGNK